MHTTLLWAPTSFLRHTAPATRDVLYPRSQPPFGLGHHHRRRQTFLPVVECSGEARSRGSSAAATTRSVQRDLFILGRRASPGGQAKPGCHRYWHCWHVVSVICRAVRRSAHSAFLEALVVRGASAVPVRCHRGAGRRRALLSRHPNRAEALRPGGLARPGSPGLAPCFIFSAGRRHVRVRPLIKPEQSSPPTTISWRPRVRRGTYRHCRGDQRPQIGGQTAPAGGLPSSPRAAGALHIQDLLGLPRSSAPLGSTQASAAASVLLYRAKTNGLRGPRHLRGM